MTHPLDSPETLLSKAAWITTHDDLPPGRRPAYEFRRTFTLPEGADVFSAHLTATAHGIYEAFINGARVGDEELTPGLTSYRKTLHVQHHDVTGLVRGGENELRLIVSDGWFRGRVGPHRVADNFGDAIAVIAALEIDTAPGHLTVCTDSTWEVTAGAIVTADLMDGQHTDLRRLGDEEWKSAVTASDPLTANRSRFAWSPAPPVRRTDSFGPVRIERLASGRQIVDFGQNINGWVRLSRLGGPGETVTLTHAEALDHDGDITQSHLDMPDFGGGAPYRVGQVDRVTSRGRTQDEFEPRHTTHGFQYVAVDGLDADLTADDLVAFQVRSDLRRIGAFETRDPMISELHRIAVASWDANSCDIPTDCPQRERWGYTGDFQIFARSAAYLDDIDGFARKWLRSLSDDQHADGLITNVAPDCGVQPNPLLPVSFDGSSGWGDAATIVPWELYRAYGDAGVLAEWFPMMSRWVEYAARVAATGRHASRIARASVPAPHERYLWDTGWHWGEWLEPDAPFTPAADQAIVATAYLANSARIVAEAAKVLGRTKDAERFAALADNVAGAWRVEFFRADGTLAHPSQANYARALAFGLIPQDMTSTVADHLVDLIEDAGDRLATGFLSTGMLLPVLAEHGHADVAYRVLFQRGEPGWLVMLERGATTVWENWAGIDSDGNAKESLNHYSKGAVITFLHEYAAGLRPLAPGYTRFEVRPHISRQLGSAIARRQSAHGTIVAGWAIENEVVTVTVTVPDGTSAVAVLPDGRREDVGPGEYEWKSVIPPVMPRRGRPPKARVVRTVVPALAGYAWGEVTPSSTLGSLLQDPESRAVIDSCCPQLARDPFTGAAAAMPLEMALALASGLVTQEQMDAVIAGLSAL